MKLCRIIFLVLIVSSVISANAQITELMRKGAELYKLPYSERKHLIKGRYMEEYTQVFDIIPSIEGYTKFRSQPFGNDNGIFTWNFFLLKDDPDEGAGILCITAGDMNVTVNNSKLTAANSGKTYNGELWHFQRKKSRHFNRMVLLVDDNKTVIFTVGQNMWILTNSLLYLEVSTKLNMLRNNNFFD